jgi:hypothetical protein
MGAGPVDPLLLPLLDPLPLPDPLPEPLLDVPVQLAELTETLPAALKLVLSVE